MKKTLLLLALGLSIGCLAPARAKEQPLATLPTVEPPAMQTSLVPEGTLLVARLKSVVALKDALEGLKNWVQDHPSVESQFDDEWDTVKKFDLCQTASEYFDLSRQDFADFFDGAITLCIGADFKWAEQSKMLPVAVSLTTRSPEKAEDFVTMLKNDEDVLDSADVAAGVLRLSLAAPDPKEEALPSSPADNKNAAETEPGPHVPLDVFITTDGPSVIVGNNLDYVIATRDASRTGARNDFLARASEADAAFWMDPRPVFALVREKLEQRAQSETKMHVDPKIIDDLGLNEIEGVGATASFARPQLRLDLFYSQNPTGIAKLFTCTPTGLAATPLIPADATEFSFGRMDLACTWSELRRLVKIVVPSTDTMYEGWQKQLQDNYGVAFERQVFGSLGEEYVFYKKGEAGKTEGSALYVAVNDAVALQGGLDALFGFFSQGKDLFNKEKIGETTVYRLKNEFQTQSAPPVAYAITPHWLIVSMGDPTQMQDLIENIASREGGNPILEKPELRTALALPGLLSLGHRPLRAVLGDVAAALLEVRQRQEQRDGAPIAEREFPSFEDVEDSVIVSTESAPGDLHTTLKVIPHE